MAVFIVFFRNAERAQQPFAESQTITSTHTPKQHRPVLNGSMDIIRGLDMLFHFV